MNGAAAQVLLPYGKRRLCGVLRGPEPHQPSLVSQLRHGYRSDDPMPKKTKGKGPSGTLSGVAATLFPFRDKVAPLDTPEYRKRAGEVIARAARSMSALAARRNGSAPVSLEPSSRCHVPLAGETCIPLHQRRDSMNRLAYSTILVALLASVASAQAQAPHRQGNVPAARISTSIPANSMTVTHWYKQSVYDPADNKIGEIMDVLSTAKARSPR
jgi:hypothetical protein